MTARVRRLVGVARNVPLPPGTYAIGAGVVIVGICSYAFQIVTYRQLTTPTSSGDYSALFGLWVVVFVLTPGLFQPLEQLVGRATAHRRARGIGAAPVTRRAATLGALLALLAIAACLAGAVPITSRVFHDNAWLFAALLVSIVVYYASYLGRGTLAGNGRFGAYGVLLSSDAIVRLVAALVLIAFGCRSLGPYGFALVLPAAVALPIALRGQKHLLEPGPPAPYSELSTALGWLLIGSVLTQVLSYSAYLSAIALQQPGDADRVGKFAAAILVARIPILLFGAVQAALLPNLSGLAGAGQEREFRLALRRIVLIVLVVGVAGIVASFLFGNAVGRLLFGTFTLGNRGLGLLAIGGAAYMLATALAQALLALQGQRAAALSWLAGCIMFVIVVALGHDLLLRSELGFAVGLLASAGAMALCLAFRMRSGTSTAYRHELSSS